MQEVRSQVPAVGVRRGWRRSVALGVSALVAVVLAGCGSGEIPTAGEEPAPSHQQEQVPHVASHIYWANNGILKNEALKATAHTIGVASLDGSGANQSLISEIGFPSGVSVRGDYVYWTNILKNEIGRATVDGAEVDHGFISEGVYFAVGITVSDEYIYWANNGTLSIGRAKLDGSEADEKFISFDVGVRMPNAVTVDDEYIYWSNVANTIGRAKLDGSEVNENFLINTGVQSGFVLSPLPVGLAVDGEYLYWSNMQENAIGRVNKDGTKANYRFITGADFPAGLAVDDQFIYWANNNGTIGRAKVDGADVNQSFITGANGPGGLAVW